jgi:rRNA maturation protein Nop10
LDKSHIPWVATQEDYETVTSAGRFKVNIMLSIAEAEADRTSERIKVVFDRKIAQGEYIGTHPPLGYSVQDKHLVPNDDAPLVREMFKQFQLTGKVFAAMDYLHEQGHNMMYNSVRRMLSNELYAGRFHGNPSYCPPIIPPAEFDRVQEMLKERSVRENPTKREYIFSGVIKCSHCGYNLVGAYNPRVSPANRYTYRCDYYYLNHNCDNKIKAKESEIEEALVAKLEQEVKTLVLEVKAKPKKARTDDKKLSRLNELYIEGIISKEEFNARRAKLITPPTPTPDLSIVKTIALSDNIRESYYSLSRQEKRMLWKSVVESIETDGKSATVIFRGSN